MKSFNKCALIGLILCASSLIGAANAGILYGIDRSDNALVSVDLETYSATVVGDLGTAEKFGGLAYDQYSDIMYMAGGRDNNSIYTIDYSTGAATLLGDHGVHDVFGLAFDSINNVLYGSTTEDELYSFDLATGAATLVGTTGFNIGGLAFDSLLNKLIGIATGGWTIFEIDRMTGNAEILLDDLPFTNDIGFTYDYDADTFYSLGLEGNLNNYAAGTFDVSLLASNLPDIDGLTYVGDMHVNVSSPSILAIFALSLFGLVAVRIKK